MNGEDLASAKVAWSIQTVDGQPALTASGQDEEVEIGMNGNHWKDWILEFDVRLESGSLTLRTRTLVEGQVFRTQITNDGASPSYEMAAAQFGSWKHVRVEARGGKVTFAAAGEAPKAVETEERVGGFLFTLEKGGSVKIRDARLKVVLFETRRGKEDEGDEDE